MDDLPGTGAKVTPRPRPTSLGVYDRPDAEGLSATDVIAAALAALWLLGVAVFFLVLPAEAPEEGPGALRTIVTAVAIVLPPGMIWLAVMTARASRAMRAETQRLQAAVDALRQSYVAQAQGAATAADPVSPERQSDESAMPRRHELAPATFSSRREATRPAPVAQSAPAELQPSLALGTLPETVPPVLETEDFVRALNFPETAEDEAGFASLRRALKDRPTAQLVQASQDVLTLLSQDGIYMDDLVPDRARPEIWRQFGQGMRGRSIAPLGGIHDRAALALTSGRMKQDPIFRDAAHHFLRLFDRTFAAFEKRASDGEVAAFADTRTARAFMLLGRVAGTFD